MQEVHSFGNVKRHAESLLHRELNRFLFVKQGEKCATKAELCKNEHLTALTISTGTHEIDEVSVPHFNKS